MGRPRLGASLLTSRTHMQTAPFYPLAELPPTPSVHLPKVRLGNSLTAYRSDAPPQAMELSLNFLRVEGTDPHSCPILWPASRCSEETNGPGLLP